jgi:pimeloyl-ACP methyl ester carboxylesterase
MAAAEPTTLRSGRRVAVYRPSEGSRTVVLCHATPGSGDFDPDPEQTAGRDVALVAVDRPGYGASDPLPPGEWASVDRAADDLAEVLEGLGTGPVGVAGWSAGGRVALALAARRPDLVDRVAVVATPAPDDAVPWYEDEFRPAIEAMRPLPPDVVHAAFAEQMTPTLPTDPHAREALEALGAGPADDEALERPGAAERLGRMLAGAYAQGAVGMAADVAGYTLRPWGFEPSAVAAKTLLLYGAADPVAGPRHARWWKENLRDARVEIAPAAGHLVIVPMWGRVLSHLAPGARR